MFNMLMKMGYEPYTVNNHNENLLHRVKDIGITKSFCEKYGDALLTVKDKDGFTPVIDAKRTIP